MVKTLDPNFKWLTSDINKTRKEVPVANIPSLWNDLLSSFTCINVLKNCRFLWFYSLVVRTLDFEAKTLSLNVLEPSTHCCSQAYPSYPSMSSYTIKNIYYRILMEKTIMYKLKWRKYMVKRILNLDVISFKDSSIVSFIVQLCLRYSPWDVTRIINLLHFRIWFHNLVVKTLDSNCKWLTSDLNKTRNEVLVANIPSVWNDLLCSVTDLSILIFIFS